MVLIHQAHEGGVEGQAGLQADEGSIGGDANKNVAHKGGAQGQASLQATTMAEF